jgi:hypothetical protein
MRGIGTGARTRGSARAGRRNATWERAGGTARARRRQFSAAPFRARNVRVPALSPSIVTAPPS